MSNVSIFEKKWIDLVFEGKNKAYGAYQLRQESPRTTVVALLFGITFLSALVFTLSSFSNSPDIIPDEPEFITPLTLAGGHEPEKKEPEKLERQAKKKEITDDLKKEDPKNLVVAKNNEQPSDVKTNEEAKKSGGSDTGSTEGTATTPSNGGGGPVTTGGSDGPGDTGPKGPESTFSLDVQPEYPGGMKKFYEYVATNFDKASIDDVEKISVLVSFVIEKDGSMTDIKVLRNPGYGLDKEAVRVLKALRTKWKPGIKDGQKVRTQYTLPITIQMMN